ncbi:MAG: hypothetical protein GF411_02915 [Candidatus Lokiarchaeota archaeon]|nr:hypothetical protein [Candidatus Lokiarchaeota archaeon]
MCDQEEQDFENEYCNNNTNRVVELENALACCVELLQKLDDIGGFMGLAVTAEQQWS